MYQAVTEQFTVNHLEAMHRIMEVTIGMIRSFLALPAVVEVSPCSFEETSRPAPKCYTSSICQKQRRHVQSGSHAQPGSALRECTRDNAYDFTSHTVELMICGN